MRNSIYALRFVSLVVAAAAAQNPTPTTIRNPHSGFAAYVPPGSIVRGKALALSGDSGKTIQCAI
jgi:hypothetical protein